MCFINQHRHFGHTTTSIVEGLHASMKAFLWSSTGDLYTVFQRFRNFLRHQADEIYAVQQYSINKISTFTLKPIYNQIRERIASKALTLLMQEHSTLKRKHNGDLEAPEGRCSPCGFKVSFGIPCRHDIFNYARAGQSLMVDAFGCYWHKQLDFTPHTAPFKPLIVQGKGRPRGSLNLQNSTRSTRREPPLHEHVEWQENAGTARPPPSTAPAALAAPTIASNSASNSSRVGLQHIEQHGDPYEAGTRMQRAYQRSARKTPISDDEDELAAQPAATAIASKEVYSQDAEHETITYTQWRALGLDWAKGEAEVDEEESAQLICMRMSSSGYSSSC